jgi:hypothetical protein
LKKRLDNIDKREKKKPNTPLRKPTRPHSKSAPGGTNGGAPGTVENDEEGWEPMTVEMKPMVVAENEKKAEMEAAMNTAAPPVNQQKTADLWKKSIQSTKRTSKAGHGFRDAVNMVIYIHTYFVIVKFIFLISAVCIFINM